MELFSVFVTGANRGIGLEFIRQLSSLPTPPRYIFATYRSKDGTQILRDIRDGTEKSQIILIKMDVTKKNEIESARKIVEDLVGVKGLTLLINNAGVLAPQPFPKVTEENLTYHYQTNTVAPVLIFQEFLPLLEKAASLGGPGPTMSVSRAAVVNISSMLGSIGMTTYTNPIFLDAFGCKVSTAALNMATRVIAASALTKEKGILVVMMCPGWVKTDMGTDMADLETNESISAMLKTFQKLNEEHHGTFVDRNGVKYEF